MDRTHWTTWCGLNLVLGLIAGAVHASCPPVPPLTCNSQTGPNACDIGAARQEAQDHCDVRTCPNEQYYCTFTQEQNQTYPERGNWRLKVCIGECLAPINQTFFAYGKDCSTRDPVESGETACPDLQGYQGVCITCDNGCLFEEAINIGYVSGTGTTVANYINLPTGAVCGYENGLPSDPPPHDEPPEDPPCEGFMVGEICVTPYHFCVDNHCVEHPPPGDCSEGAPTICVGNPPPPPDPDLPPHPDPDPCESGTATADGESYGVNIHCVDIDNGGDDDDGGGGGGDDDDPDNGEGEQGNFCEANPDHVNCTTYCGANPDDPLCGENGPGDQGDGEGDESGYCIDNPSSPSCQGSDFCDSNPEHPSCQGGDFCEQNPESPICAYCEQHPEQPVCGGEGTCASNPADPACQHCALNPTDPVCENSGNTCQDNPDHESCGAGNASGGGTCQAPPVCTGDSISCAILYQQWRTRCALENTSDEEDWEDPQESPDQYHQEESIGIGMLDTSGFLGGGVCPQWGPINVLGGSFDLPQVHCDLMSWFGFLLVGGALVVAARIIGGP